MKYALIGSGFIMPRHAEAIFATGGKITEVINTHPGEEHWRMVVKNTEADCVVILTPNDLHYPIALAAAARGKTVLSEKPLGISSEEIKELAKYKNIFTVLQLHHHPLVKQLRAEVSPQKHYDIEMDIAVHRDPYYYKQWQGQKERSGGVLINLGIHYFDMLLHLFGQPTKTAMTSLDDITGTGTIEGKNWQCRFHVSTGEAREKQRRVFKINGVDYNFSSKDNLSHENLHRHIYEDLLKGKGATASEVLPATELIEELYQQAKTPLTHRSISEV